MHRRTSLLIAVLSLLGVTFGAAAQDVGRADGMTSGEVAVKCSWFGIGNWMRPGEWTGICVSLNDSADKPREVLVRLTLPDNDGDRTQWEASITTNPGVTQNLWMYARLPSSFRRTDQARLHVFAAEETTGAAGRDVSALTAGRQLNSILVGARSDLTSSEGMIGIVGNRRMGIGAYQGSPDQATARSGGSITFLPGAHERYEVFERLDAESLPDRWMGFMSLSVLVWNDPPPSSLTSDKAQAIREWVQRGGHLIVVLPRVSQTWTDEASNPLFDIVPRVRVIRHEGSSLDPLRALITRDSRVEMPSNEVLQTMLPVEGASLQEASCVIAMPDGSPAEWLVSRRQVGLGMVTMVGLDTSSRWMDQRALPQPELFWHRIIGRRGPVSVKEDDKLGSQLSPSPATLDNGIADRIAKKGKAETGVLVGLVVFLLYWLIAGPLGYAALKKTGRQRHAWIGFVGAAALFTGIAWGGATIIRPAHTSAAHLTLLDHVYSPQGESLQRARSWMSLLIPEYGESGVSVGDPTKAATARFHNIIAPWEPEGQRGEGFPDARGYRVDSRSPDHYTIPTRSTVKQFQVDWAGGPTWTMPHPEADTNGKPLDLSVERVRIDRKDQIILHGTLIHDMPDDLQDMQVFVNVGQVPLSASLGQPAEARKLTAETYFIIVPRAWAPKTQFDLSTLKEWSPGMVQPRSGYLDQLLSTISTDSSNIVRDLDTDKMRALTFLGLFDAGPDRAENQSNWLGRKLLCRRTTHGYDHSQWMTQPCVIITGWIGRDHDTPSPVPLMVGSGSNYRAVPSAGRTFVRWVYPLPPAPPKFNRAETSPDPAEPTTKPEDDSR